VTELTLRIKKVPALQMVADETGFDAMAWAKLYYDTPIIFTRFFCFYNEKPGTSARQFG
jgi:hypothetical protein